MKFSLDAISRIFMLAMLVIACGFISDAAKTTTSKHKVPGCIPVDSIPGSWTIVSIQDKETGELIECHEEFTICPFEVDYKNIYKYFKFLPFVDKIYEKVVIEQTDKGDIKNSIGIEFAKPAGSKLCRKISFSLEI